MSHTKEAYPDLYVASKYSFRLKWHELIAEFQWSEHVVFFSNILHPLFISPFKYFYVWVLLYSELRGLNIKWEWWYIYDLIVSSLYKTMHSFDYHAQGIKWSLVDNRVIISVICGIDVFLVVLVDLAVSGYMYARIILFE